jgi:4-amino-4-deoxy-L-arabinose transferase-like glycosyltransferase
VSEVHGVTLPVSAPLAASRSNRLRVGVVSWAGAVAVNIWSNFGGSDTNAGQQRAVPFVIAALAVAALVVFGAIVPRAVGRNEIARPGRPGLVLAVIAVVLVPLTFWSGLPIIVAAASLLVTAGAEPRGVERSGAPRVVAIVAVVGTIVLAILANTVLA